MKRRSEKFWYPILCLVFTLFAVCVSPVYAEGGLGSVQVIVENRALAKADGAPWDGVLLEEDVPLTKDMSMMGVVQAAFEQAGGGHQLEISESGYILTVDELQGGGEDSRQWLGMLNGWYVSSGYNGIPAEDGDAIRIVYTTTNGVQEGSMRDSTDTSLDALECQEGQLLPGFSADVHAYSLDLPAGTEKIHLTPTAKNKNYQVRVYKGEDPDRSQAGYKRTEEIPVRAGDVLTVICGDPSWPSMSAQSEATEYTVKVGIGKLLEQEQVIEWRTGTDYDLDLGTIFLPDGDAALTYAYSLDGGAFIETPQQFTFTPSEARDYTVQFRAAVNGQQTAVYKLVLSVDDGADRAIEIVSSAHGTVSADCKTAQRGQKVVLKVEAEAGYALKELSTISGSGQEEIAYDPLPFNGDKDIFTTQNKTVENIDKNKYVFKMPGADITITARFESACPAFFYGAMDFKVRKLTDFKIYDASGREHVFEKLDGNITPFLWLVAGRYEYRILRRGSGELVKTGSFEVQDSQCGGTSEFDGTDYHFSMRRFWIINIVGVVGDADFKRGFEVTVQDGEGREVPLSGNGFGLPAAGGGYSDVYYFFEAGAYDWLNGVSIGAPEGTRYDYTYSAHCVDPRVDSSRLKGGFSFTHANGNQREEYLQPSAIVVKTSFKISKGAKVTLARSAGSAYAPLDEIEWDSIDRDSDPDYDIYTHGLYVGGGYDMVAESGEKKYRKHAFFFGADEKKTEVTIDLEEAGSKTKGQAAGMNVGNDLYTNVGNGGYMEIAPGETKKIEAFRVAQTTRGAITNQFVEPDMEYKVIAGQENIQLTDAGQMGRKYKEITASGTGISVIAVTYGDMLSWEGMLQVMGIRAAEYWDPIDPENTGIIIVNANGTSGEIRSGIEWTNGGTYNTVYFTADPDGTSGEGSTYRFTPSAGTGRTITSVRVRDPFLGREGEAWEDEKYWHTLEDEDKDGAYVFDLKSGRNIVEIRDDAGHVLYDTINAKQVKVNIKNTTNPDRPLAVGDTAEITFEGLELPVYKMAGIYNPGYPDTTWVEYQGKQKGSDGESTTVRSRGIQYVIHQYNTLTVQIGPGGDYELTGGRIHCGHLGSALDTHLNIPPGGVAPNLNASGGANDPYFSRLPNITLTVQDRGPETDVMDLIAKIDPDYLSCIRTIMDARAAYDRLSAGDKAKVTNYERLTTAEADPAVARTIPVVRKIDALPGSASLADEGAIRDADQAYRGLSSDAERNAADQATDSRLTGLVSRLEQLIAEEARRARIDAVSSLIAGLPGEDAVTGEDTVIAAINEAKRAYDALSAGEQAEVAGAAKLTGLVQSLPDLNAANNVIHAIAAIGGVTQEDYLEKTRAAEQAASLYRNLTERQQGYVSNRDVLEKAQYDIDYYGAEQAVRPAMEKLAALREALTQMQASGKPAGEGWIQWKEQIEEAQGAYDALADSQKESLADYAGVLEDARAYTLQAEADEVAVLIGALPDPETVGAYDPAQTQGQLTEEQVAAIAAAQNALQALTQEETVLLPAGAQEKLLALVEKAKTYPGYTEAHLRAYIEEFTQSCQRYQETGVLRKDMETITALLERYDSYTPEEQAVLDQSLAEMAGWLRGEAQRIADETQATDDLTSKIQALPSTVDIQAWQGIQEEIQAIEAGYEALSADAKGYVTGMERLESLKAQVRVFQAQAAQFQAGTPAVTAVADTPTQVTLTWDRYADATSYRIYRRVGRGGWKELTVTGALSYVDRDVKGSTTYTYAVRALSTKWGQTVESAMDEDGTAVTTPFGTVTKLKSARAVRYDRVTLTWTRCADASGYEVYRAEAIRGTYEKVKTLRGSGTVTWTDTKLRTGRTYFYKIKAYRTQGGQVQRAGDSNVKSAKPTLSAAVLGRVSAGRKRAAVSWKKVNGASGYVLYRSTKKNGGYKAVRIVKRAAAGKYTDKKLKTGKTYYYRMRAYRTVDGKRVYGGYSKVRAVRVR